MVVSKKYLITQTKMIIITRMNGMTIQFPIATMMKVPTSWNRREKNVEKEPPKDTSM